MARVSKTPHHLTRLIRGYGITAPKLADILNCSPPTARKKLSQPELLTVGDLERISRKGGIPMEEIRVAIE